ncbi:hypothetical protein [Cardinium endosymbiont of Dermatophagoides farinae]|uniref:hypothetical protein n=1 Tax=Cardinium endosymbiont of Dermatophagoides farinae TaxID=2597823 RepID=UPI001183862C|nr:hypothetical protein [Cardinium endosymbiont of Dermatophagoides farinae]TSJ80087.1 hypothetical protein FPG78_06350 [Cardinium endosymbiont of Dermatophagoides farinae]
MIKPLTVLCRGNLSADMIQKIVSSATNPTMSAFSTLNAVRQKDMKKLNFISKRWQSNESTVTFRL